MRYYSATLGRWISRDPLGDLGGANVYAYVGNNPTNFTDYLGLASASCRAGEPCHSGLFSPGGGEPWSPEPTAVEEGDRRPCPHRGDRGDRDVVNILPLSPEQLIEILEELERRELLARLSRYERGMFDFGEAELVRLWFETYKALPNRHNARFRGIFQHFVEAWYRAHRAWLRNRVFPRVEVKRHIRGPLGWGDTFHNVLLIGSFGMVGAVVGDAAMDTLFVPMWAPPDKEIRGDWFFCTRRVIGICISLVEVHFDDFEGQE